MAQMDGTGKDVARIWRVLRNAKSILALVGPEGGWTSEEIEQSINAGAQPISLGPNILRIETATITLAVAIHGILHVDR